MSIIVNAQWYVPYKVIHGDLCISSVKDEIKQSNDKYHEHLRVCLNQLALKLQDNYLF